MAVTGTGTIDDPYILSEWDEFVSKCAENNAYIKVADNTVWDMNLIHEEPFTETAITVNATYIDGNGVTIRNLNVENCIFLVVNNRSLKNVYMYRFKFEDFYITRTKSSSCTLMFANAPQYFVVAESVVKGEFYSSYSTSETLMYGSLYRCAMTIKCDGKWRAYPNMGGITHIYDCCNIKIQSTNNDVMNFADVYNTYFSGSFENGVKFTSCLKSVLNAEIQTSLEVSGTNKYTVINADKIAEGLTIPASLISCTDEEMHSAEALKVKGFPIGV